MKEKIQVIHTNGCKTDFKPRLISQQIKKETNVSDELAEKIQRRVSNQLYKLNVDEISTSLIRSQVSSQLLKEGMVDDAEKSRKMGMNYLEIEDLLKSHSTENANNNDNSESFYKRVAEKTLEEYTFSRLPKRVSEAHRNGFIHIHDRADFFIKPNCFSYDLRWLLKNGFSPDGEMKLGAVSESPKHFDTLMNLIHELLGCGKIDLSGGQGFPHFNTLVSVCSIDLTYKELKQSLQSLLFNLNQAIMSKGEVVFSSLGFDLEVPSYMENEPAIGLGGVVRGVYGDYNEEVKRILKIWCELLKEGDALGRPFRFPNNLFNLRNDYKKDIDEQLYWICDYLCKFPTGYFVNDDLENTGGISSVMGCFDGSEGLWTLVDNNVKYYTFEELSELFNADYGVTDISGYNFKVLTINDNREVVWHEVSNFIKNKDRVLYEVKLNNGKSFVCDDLHEMIKPDLSKINIMNAVENKVKIIDVCINSLSSIDSGKFIETTIESITQIGRGDSYCLEVNDRIIVSHNFILTAQCRTRSTNADTRYNWIDNTMNTGNLAFHSLNLPLLALESNNLEEFYTLLEQYTNICLESLFIRRKAIEKRLEDGKLPFLTWKDKQSRRTLYEIDRTTLSVGYVGLNECIRELSNDNYDITTKDGVQLGKDIINFIQKIINKEIEKTGYKIGVFSTPAESTAGRFARINKTKYPNAKVCGSGDEIYYTNSHHIDVGKEVPLTHVLNNADEFHKLTPFGAICHVFLGEKPNLNSLIKLTKMIKSKDIGFWSYTLDFSVCEVCGHTVLKSVDECPNCGSKHIIIYSKITGYYVPVKKISIDTTHYQWNKGKLGEFRDRNRYILEDDFNDN